MENNVVDFHDVIASSFNDRYETSKAFQERFTVWIRLFERYLKPTDHVMDLGCGSGVFSDYLAGKGCVVTGIDGSEAMITLGKQKKMAGSVRYVVQSLPLPNPTQYAPQDVLLMSSVLEYLDDITEMLEQANVLLKPNGLLIVSIPNHISVYRAIERVIFWLTKRPTYFAFIRHTSTKLKFNKWLTQLGFEPLETVYFSSYDPISSVLKPFFAEQYVNNLLVGVYRKRTDS